MPEIAKYSNLYIIGEKCVQAYKKGGFENNPELDKLMQQLVDEIAKIDPIARGLIYSGAKLSMLDKWDKYAWVCSTIEFINSENGSF